MYSVEDGYDEIISGAEGTSHYMLVKTHCKLMRSFDRMSTTRDKYLLLESANCAEDYSIAVRRYLAGVSDDE